MRIEDLNIYWGILNAEVGLKATISLTLRVSNKVLALGFETGKEHETLFHGKTWLVDSSDLNFAADYNPSIMVVSNRNAVSLVEANELLIGQQRSDELDVRIETARRVLWLNVRL